jgi:hypothetical protein
LASLGGPLLAGHPVSLQWALNPAGKVCAYPGAVKVNLSRDRIACGIQNCPLTESQYSISMFDSAQYPAECGALVFDGPHFDLPELAEGKYRLFKGSQLAGVVAVTEKDPPLLFSATTRDSIQYSLFLDDFRYRPGQRIVFTLGASSLKADGYNRSTGLTNKSFSFELLDGTGALVQVVSLQGDYAITAPSLSTSTYGESDSLPLVLLHRPLQVRVRLAVDGEAAFPELRLVVPVTWDTLPARFRPNASYGHTDDSNSVRATRLINDASHEIDIDSTRFVFNTFQFPADFRAGIIQDFSLDTLSLALRSRKSGQTFSVQLVRSCLENVPGPACSLLSTSHWTLAAGDTLDILNVKLNVRPGPGDTASGALVEKYDGRLRLYGKDDYLDLSIYSLRPNTLDLAVSPRLGKPPATLDHVRRVDALGRAFQGFLSRLVFPGAEPAKP